MSINLSPKGQPPVPVESHLAKTESKQSLCVKWMTFIKEGYQQESMPCKSYCLKKLNYEGKSLPFKIFENLMQDCQSECEEYKRFIRRDRKSF